MNHPNPKMPRGQTISTLTKDPFRYSRDCTLLAKKKLSCQVTKHETHTKQEESSKNLAFKVTLMLLLPPIK